MWASGSGCHVPAQAAHDLRGIGQHHNIPIGAFDPRGARTPCGLVELHPYDAGVRDPDQGDHELLTRVSEGGPFVTDDRADRDAAGRARGLRVPDDVRVSDHDVSCVCGVLTCEIASRGRSVTQV